MPTDDFRFLFDSEIKTERKVSGSILGDGNRSFSGFSVISDDVTPWGRKLPFLTASTSTKCEGDRLISSNLSIFILFCFPPLFDFRYRSVFRPRVSYVKHTNGLDGETRSEVYRSSWNMHAFQSVGLSLECSEVFLPSTRSALPA